MGQVPIRIAYADHYSLVRKGIVSLIERMGFEVFIEADDGLSLVNLIERSPEVPDLCLLDINMPKMNGFDTLVELKKKWPDMPVLVLTVFQNEFYIIRMIMNGANGYLLKTCSLGEFRKAILSVYNEGIYYSDVVSRSYFHSIHNNKMKMPMLTARETEVIIQCCSDLSYAEIAVKIGSTTKSVEGCRDSIFRKLNINSRVSLAIFAIRFGLLQVETQYH